MFRVVDLLDLASSWNIIKIDYVKPTYWLPKTLLTLFKTFFTLVLLQQVFAAVRRSRLLRETIEDFWSPHTAIHERARTALAQYGPGAVWPLIRSLQAVETLLPLQRESLPGVLAEIGPVCVPILRQQLRDRNENVRGVSAAALGQLHA